MGMTNTFANRYWYLCRFIVFHICLLCTESSSTCFENVHLQTLPFKQKKALILIKVVIKVARIGRR